ncbi:S9 family peptidase [Plantactinospora mayteni]|uniref:Peptidase n=1 Tax=Plantactinospora mayteni TaxID=566021 RepID=A0ABQ4EZM0_9ACTN|nr:prolyl oligopeptidase family serine peptidase [Plantactinospora mayteni]GIH00106.1 peptidase [Plantactinospora mayteni]
MLEGIGVETVAVDPRSAEVGANFDWLTSVGARLSWVETQPSTGRAIAVLSASTGLTGYSVPGGSVGSSLHAYGGMPHLFAPSGALVAVDAATGRLITPFGHTGDDGFTYGDLAGCGDEMLAVREHERGDQLVALDRASGELRVLLTTDGFLASPRFHEGRLAWTRWTNDVMPWDSCEIWIANYTPGQDLSRPRRLAGGPTESAIQPCWGIDGTLYFMSDRSGWWNLYRWRNGPVEAVAPMSAECATAPWESGYTNFALLPAGQVVMTVQSGPEQQLLVVERDGASRVIQTPYTSTKPYIAATGNRVAFIGASPTRAPEIAVATTDGSDKIEIIRRSTTRVEEPAASTPELHRVSTGGGTTITVLLYPPSPVEGRLPPLIVRPHAGPTYHSEFRLDREVQFFTSRGFAVAEVDYRGSTGYGRTFRKALDGNWGRFDVEDCRNAALHLIASGRVCPDAVFISGASAGGYTALKAVCEDGPFALAVARSAIIDPERWRTTAPRFQRPHATILASATSPVVAAAVRQQVLLVHGAADQVAPVDDADELATALRQRGLLAGLVRFDGVGHYLSGSAQQVALDAELATYRKALLDLGIVMPA